MRDRGEKIGILFIDVAYATGWHLRSIVRAARTDIPIVTIIVRKYGFKVRIKALTACRSIPMRLARLVMADAILVRRLSTASSLRVWPGALLGGGIFFRRRCMVL